MCGIAGFIGKGDRGTIKKMANTLHHRGPDEEGFFIDEKNRVFLGFRRLAIIDLATGAQPMTNEDGSVIVVFNGEIYNFQELRADLEKRHVFKTNSDTEVIAHLYEEIGERCFEKFNGMFAVAIWDARKKRLVLARDRMGKKPLYWAKRGDTFLFGSELKALLVHPSVARQLNRESVLKYFFFLNVPSPQTIFEGIQKLEPGQMLVYEPQEEGVGVIPPPAGGGGEEGVGEKNIHPSFYWQPHYEADPTITVSDALAELGRLLEDATRLRLVSDVPLGIFLSGGIDSSTIAYYAAKASAKPIRTFSIGFAARDYDESAYAKMVSERIGSEHVSERFEPKILLDLLPDAAATLDEPLSDAAFLPTLLLSRFARKHVTVALGGDGGDELFLGYPTFQAHRLAEWYRLLPRFLRERAVPFLAHLLPVRHGGLSLDYKVKAFARNASQPVGIRQQAWISSFGPSDVPGLFTEEFLDGIGWNALSVDMDAKLAALKPRSVDEAAMFLYERYFLGDQVLTKVDRASMAASLEVRAPFLDVRLVEYAHRLPVSLKLRFWRNKYLLKKLMRGRLPDAVLNRPKQGFWTPVGPWLRGGELGQFMDMYFTRNRIEQDGIFRYDGVMRLVREHRNGIRDHRRIIWSLLMFQLWKERWHSLL